MIRRTVPMRMRWKLLAAFGTAFTVVFAFISVFVLIYSTDVASERLFSQLRNTALGGSEIIDADAFERLTQEPAVPDPAHPSGLGYPDSDSYRRIARQLFDMKVIVPDAETFTYFRDPSDGELYFAASHGYLLDPQVGVRFREPIAGVVDPQTYTKMEAGLLAPSEQLSYIDEYGEWATAYAPIKTAAGDIVGAIGVDYPLDYLDEVRANVVRRTVPILAITYIVLLGLVVAISASIVKPVRRLTVAAKRVADGEYDLDMGDVVDTHFPDEMSELAHAFAQMAEKVAKRERTLTKEVQRLRVEIDHAKRVEAVKEIVETDFFTDLTSKAKSMRRRMREPDGTQRD